MSPARIAWLPNSVLLLRDYDRHKFLSDLLAGVTVGLVALPLAMAFAIASGVSPQAGIYCAIVTGFLISALGGSKTQIGGPPVRLSWWSLELSRGTASKDCSPVASLAVMILCLKYAKRIPGQSW
jgi:MFS superfamily sulfate permease-like transporter